MDECIFITGAGAGIGRETALLFASKGWFVGAAVREYRYGAAERIGFPVFERLGVNLTPDVVADQVWAQVQHPRLHRPVSMQFRTLWPIARSAPASITRGVLGKLWRV